MPDDDKDLKDVSDDDLEATLSGDTSDTSDTSDDSSDDSDDSSDDSHDGDDHSDNDDDADNDDDDKGGDDKGDEIDWEKELHKAKTNFGRKTKNLEDQVKSLTDNMNSLVDLIKSGGLTKQAGNQDNDKGNAFDDDTPIPLTMGGLAQVIAQMNNQTSNKQSESQKKYENGYMKTVENLGSSYSDKVHKVIVERMFKDFNVKHSDNPALDAQLNFREAEAAILREVRTRKANPLDKNKGKKNKGLGGSTGSDQDTRQSDPITLDKYASDFIASIGMSEDDAKKALEGDMPMYLRGKVGA